MASIPTTTFKDWKDGDIVTAAEYERELEIIRTAINDNHSRVSSLQDLAGGSVSRIPHGIVFPTVNIEPGYIFYRSDQETLYVLNPNSQWISVSNKVYEQALNWVKGFGLGTAAPKIWGNLNDLDNTGFYTGQAGLDANFYLTNAPNTFGYFFITNIKWDGNSRWQTAQELGTGNTYTRKCNNGVWSGWTTNLIKSGETVEGNVSFNGQIEGTMIREKTSGLLIGGDPNGGAGFSAERIVFSVGNYQYFTFDDAFGANALGSGLVRFLMHHNEPTFRMEKHDGTGATLVVQTVSNTSDREKKKNIVDYENSALEEINSTPIRNYNFKNEVDGVDLPHIGVIMQEAPLDVVDFRGQGIDTYAMVSMAWKAIQELSAKNQDLEERLALLEAKEG